MQRIRTDSPPLVFNFSAANIRHYFQFKELFFGNFFFPLPEGVAGGRGSRSRFHATNIRKTNDLRKPKARFFSPFLRGPERLAQPLRFLRWRAHFRREEDTSLGLVIPDSVVRKSFARHEPRPLVNNYGTVHDSFELQRRHAGRSRSDAEIA